MSDNLSPYTLIGAEESPYSVKVRSYLTYKKLPMLWRNRSEAQAQFAEHARLPLIPLLISPAGEAAQDSTPIIEALENKHPHPTIYPPDPVAGFVNVLLEEFADEWGNKWMFHYRWAREVDQLACSRRLASAVSPEATDTELDQMAAQIRTRMVDRVWFVGSSAQTAPQIEASFKDFLELCDRHLSQRPYLFGARPAFADFALWGQLYNCHRDPTPRGIMEIRAPHVMSWLTRMAEPMAEGEFEDWLTLADTLQPILTDQVGGLFLPWSEANANALARGEDEFTVTLSSGEWTQKPQKYHANSLAALRAKYDQVDTPATKRLMDACGCLQALDPAAGE
ncbi:MAG: glutathione S-transferase family protein [Pseudomonadota bacterium]